MDTSLILKAKSRCLVFYILYGDLFEALSQVKGCSRWILFLTAGCFSIEVILSRRSSCMLVKESQPSLELLFQLVTLSLGHIGGQTDLKLPCDCTLNGSLIVNTQQYSF